MFLLASIHCSQQNSGVSSHGYSLSDDNIAGMYLISQRKDSSIYIPIEDASGGIWYRGSESGFSADCMLSEFTTVENVTDTSFGIFILLREECSERLYLWTKANIGRLTGLVVHDKLVLRAELVVPLRQSILVGPFESKDTAENWSSELKILANPSIRDDSAEGTIGGGARGQPGRGQPQAGFRL